MGARDATSPALPLGNWAYVEGANYRSCMVASTSCSECFGVADFLRLLWTSLPSHQSRTVYARPYTRDHRNPKPSPANPNPLKPKPHVLNSKLNSVQKVALSLGLWSSGVHNFVDWHLPGPCGIYGLGFGILFKVQWGLLSKPIDSRVSGSGLGF